MAWNTAADRADGNLVRQEGSSARATQRDLDSHQRRRVGDRNLQVGESVLTDCDQPKGFVSARTPADLYASPGKGLAVKAAP
jgi:hypothetical protein